MNWANIIYIKYCSLHHCRWKLHNSIWFYSNDYRCILGAFICYYATRYVAISKTYQRDPIYDLYVWTSSTIGCNRCKILVRLERKNFIQHCHLSNLHSVHSIKQLFGSKLTQFSSWLVCIKSRSYLLLVTWNILLNFFNLMQTYHFKFTLNF